MARIRKPALLEKVYDGLASGGASVHVINWSHPSKVLVSNGVETKRFRIYIWNITHGGGHARAADEFRIQVTGVTRFDPDGVDQVLILGWWEEGGVFTGWDFRKHSGRLGSSPSLQVGRQALLMANRDEVGWHRKDNGETAVAMQPRMLMAYAFNASAFHTAGEAMRDIAIVRDAVASETRTSFEAVEEIPANRRTIISTVIRKVRDTAFSAKVMNAYGHSCAMCGMQLRLLDAAHIVPVEEDGTDETPNGLALCAIHHRAFDKSLVTFKPDFSLHLNPTAIARLRAEDRIGGMEAFRSNLRAVLHVPPASRDQPRARYIEKANRLRGWVQFEAI